MTTPDTFVDTNVDAVRQVLTGILSCLLCPLGKIPSVKPIQVRALSCRHDQDGKLLDVTVEVTRYGKVQPPRTVGPLEWGRLLHLSTREARSYNDFRMKVLT